MIKENQNYLPSWVQTKKVFPFWSKRPNLFILKIISGGGGVGGKSGLERIRHTEGILNAKSEIHV